MWQIDWIGKRWIKWKGWRAEWESGGVSWKDWWTKWEDWWVEWEDWVVRIIDIGHINYWSFLKCWIDFKRHFWWGDSWVKQKNGLTLQRILKHFDRYWSIKRSNKKTNKRGNEWYCQWSKQENDRNVKLNSINIELNWFWKSTINNRGSFDDATWW